MMSISRCFRLFAPLALTITLPALAELPEAWKERYIENTVKEVVGKASRDAHREVNRRPEISPQSGGHGEFGGRGDGGFAK